MVVAVIVRGIASLSPFAPAVGSARLRIAQVAPLAESVPPARYGGTERVVAYLSEALMALGHEVTLFASGDSTARVPLVACCEASLREHGGSCDGMMFSVLQLQAVLDRSDEFDVLHFHNGYTHVLLARELVPHVTTLHGRLDHDPPNFYAAFPGEPFVSVSDAQRAPLPHANWARTVHHGLPRDVLAPGAGRGGYLAFIGRLSVEKRVDRAIEIARRAGMPLKIMAKIDPADAAYVEREIRHLLNQPGVEFLGEGNESAKSELLADAAALLFPIDWPEPFGLVMIESLACATPVIAYRNGSVPEVIDDGQTGFIVESIDEAVAAVRRLERIDRTTCRETFARRFTAERMAQDYVGVYRSLLAEGLHANSSRWQAQSR